MIPAIPRYLMPHSAVLKKKISEDKWGGGKYEETPLSFIRIVPCRGQRFSLSGDIPEVSAKMFFDLKSSVPCRPPPDFSPGDVICFEGRDYVIKRVDTHYVDVGEIHHLEVELV